MAQKKRAGDSAAVCNQQPSRRSQESTIRLLRFQLSLLRFGIHCYERELSEIEKNGGRPGRLARTIRGRVLSAFTQQTYSTLLSAALWAALDVARTGSGDDPVVVETYNTAVSALVKQARTIPEKEALIRRMSHATRIGLGWRLCQYCGCRLPPDVRDGLCSPPAKCRKALANRRAYLRRKPRSLRSLLYEAQARAE